VAAIFCKGHKRSSAVLERSAQVIFVFATRISCGQDCSEAKFDSAARVEHSQQPETGSVTVWKTRLLPLDRNSNRQEPTIVTAPAHVGLSRGARNSVA
jgi:hypothetical protein